MNKLNILAIVLIAVAWFDKIKLQIQNKNTLRKTIKILIPISVLIIIVVTEWTLLEYFNPKNGIEINYENGIQNNPNYFFGLVIVIFAGFFTTLIMMREK